MQMSGPIPLTDVPANFIQGTVRVRNRAVPVEKRITGVSAVSHEILLGC